MKAVTFSINQLSIKEEWRKTKFFQQEDMSVSSAAVVMLSVLQENLTQGSGHW